jgi:hypothetical protein
MVRFTIRDLLWVTALVAILAAWWVDRSALVGRLARLKADFHLSRAVDGVE